MNQAARIRKMQAVLDGEATPEETREIQALLARDAQARAEYESLERLFAALRDVPQAHAPEGLLAAATRRFSRARIGITTRERAASAMPGTLAAGRSRAHNALTESKRM